MSFEFVRTRIPCAGFENKFHDGDETAGQQGTIVRFNRISDVLLATCAQTIVYHVECHYGENGLHVKRCPEIKGSAVLITSVSKRDVVFGTRFLPYTSSYEYAYVRTVCICKLLFLLYG